MANSSINFSQNAIPDVVIFLAPTILIICLLLRLMFPLSNKTIGLSMQCFRFDGYVGSVNT